MQPDEDFLSDDNKTGVFNYPRIVPCRTRGFRAQYRANAPFAGVHGSEGVQSESSLRRVRFATRSVPDTLCPCVLKEMVES